MGMRLANRLRPTRSDDALGMESIHQDLHVPRYGCFPSGLAV